MYDTVLVFNGFSAEEEKEIRSSFDWYKSLEKAFKDNDEPDVSSEQKIFEYMAGFVERYHSSCPCSVRIRRISGDDEPVKLEVSFIFDPHKLNGPPDEEERREYYAAPGGVFFLYIKNSRRGGVYRCADGKWQYDPTSSSTFEWDRPAGKRCGFLPEDVELSVRFDAFLSYSELLLREENVHFYARFDEEGHVAKAEPRRGSSGAFLRNGEDLRISAALPQNGEDSGIPAAFPQNGEDSGISAALPQNREELEVPAAFPQDREKLREQYMGPSFRLMLECLGEDIGSRHLEYPDIDRLEERIDSLNISECRQYMLLYFRAALKYGQEFYYSGWRSGKLLRVINRMRALQLPEDLCFEQPGMDDRYAEAYEDCDRYCSTEYWPDDDSVFSGSMLSRLKTADRLKIERKVIRRACEEGDTRFFGALDSIRYYSLRDHFTGESLRGITSLKERTLLLTALYRATHDMVYLENLLRLAGGYEPAYHKVCNIIFNDPEEKEAARWRTDEYSLMLHCLKTIETVRRSAGQRLYNSLFGLYGYDKKQYAAVGMLDREEVGRVLDIGSWAFEGSDRALKFYEALSLIFQYTDTGDKEYLRRMVADALDHPEVYNVMRYMISLEVIKERPLAVLEEGWSQALSGN